MAGALDGQVALVTGSGRGIGRELATGLAAAGARVAVVARTQIEIDEVAQTIVSAGGTAIAIPTELGDPNDLYAVLETTTAAIGAVDILINNAAVVAPLGPTRSLKPADVQRALAVNVAAAVILSGLVLPAMIDVEWGRIINVSSGVATHPTAMIGGSVYTASKAALEAHTLNLAAELEGTGVTVNAYRPGAVDTAMQAWIRDQSPDAIGQALHERFVASHASGDLLTPHESAARLLDRLTSNETGRIWSVSDPLT
jgi:3-oxoacyl-[acyl-carrier protein] reductase